MRVTCLLCVRKHLGKAEALMTEVRQGYPHHAGLAIGNLSEAADEALQDHPELAAEIRRHWKAYELDEAGYEVPTVSLLKTVEELLQAVRVKQEAEKGDTRPSFVPSGDQLGGTVGDPATVASSLASMAKSGTIRKPPGDFVPGERHGPDARPKGDHVSAGDASIIRPLGG